MTSPPIVVVIETRDEGKRFGAFTEDAFRFPMYGGGGVELLQPAVLKRTFLFDLDSKQKHLAKESTHSVSYLMSGSPSRYGFWWTRSLHLRPVRQKQSVKQGLKSYDSNDLETEQQPSKLQSQRVGLGGLASFLVKEIEVFRVRFDPQGGVEDMGQIRRLTKGQGTQPNHSVTNPLIESLSNLMPASGLQAQPQPGAFGAGMFGMGAPNTSWHFQPQPNAFGTFQAPAASGKPVQLTRHNTRTGHAASTWTG